MLESISLKKTKRKVKLYLRNGVLQKNNQMLENVLFNKKIKKKIRSYLPSNCPLPKSYKE
jgi:hypothetical protein